MQEKTSAVIKRTEQEMFNLIRDQQSGELTVKDFCKQNNVSEGTFYYWRKKYHDTVKPTNEEEPAGFSLLHLNEEAKSSSGLFAEYKGLKLYSQVTASYLKELMS